MKKWFMYKMLPYLVLCFIWVIMVGPILWTVLTSFKPESEIQSYPLTFWPENPTLKNYERAFSVLPLGRFFLNSIITASLTVITNVVFATLAGYTFARKNFRGKNLLFLLVLSTIMIPFHIRLIPTYMMIMKLNLLDTYSGIFLPISVTAFGIFLMRQYFLSFPREIEDAGLIDGCSPWGVFFRLVLPVSKPGIATVAIFSMLQSWDDFLWPLVVTSKTDMFVLPVGISLFLGLKVYEWGPVMAVASMATIPVIIVYIFLQKYFIAGLTAGAVKE